MLEIRDLHAWHGAAQALFGVSLTVGRGELVVLQGLNGAGKSTLLQGIMGIGPRVEGAVRYQKESILELPTHQRALLGLGYVPEDRRLFTALTVRENLLIAERQGNASVLAQRQEQVLQLFPALKGMLGRSAAHMSGGEQQMLAIARTLMAGPSLLLLDEPCEGISPVLVESIRDALLSLKAQGIPMLIAEQNGVLTARADRVITLTAQSPLDA
ncbi:MAG: ATP-binding cassette domain-containing protein [Burkholderiales bacterium]